MGADTETLRQIVGGPWEARKRRGGRTIGARGDENTRRLLPAESTKQDSEGATEIEGTATEPVWVFTRSSAYRLWLFSFEFLFHNRYYFSVNTIS